MKLQIDIDTPKRRIYAAKKLKEAIAKRDINGDNLVKQSRYYVKLPAEDSHNNHLVGEV
jgi:hypothetical protein